MFELQAKKRCEKLFFLYLNRRPSTDALQTNPPVGQSVGCIDERQENKDKKRGNEKGHISPLQRPPASTGKETVPSPTLPRVPTLQNFSKGHKREAKRGASPLNPPGWLRYQQGDFRCRFANNPRGSGGDAVLKQPSNGPHHMQERGLPPDAPSKVPPLAPQPGAMSPPRREGVTPGAKITMTCQKTLPLFCSPFSPLALAPTATPGRKRLGGGAL